MRTFPAAIAVVVIAACKSTSDHADAGSDGGTFRDAGAAHGGAGSAAPRAGTSAGATSRSGSSAAAGAVAMGASGRAGAAGHAGASGVSAAAGAAAGNGNTAGAIAPAAGSGAVLAGHGGASPAAGSGGAGGAFDSTSVGGVSGAGGTAAAGGAAGASGAGGAAGARAATCAGQTPYPDVFLLDPKLCLYVYASNLGSARQMAFAPNGDLFVNNGELTVLFDANGNGTSEDGERSTFATAANIQHGLAFSRDGAFVYASSPTTVYRWPYTSGKRSGAGAGEVVLKNIPSGGHSTRTLAFDSQGRLIVSVGSASNVDTTQMQWDTRALVRRFTLPSAIPSGGIDFGSGTVIASGMRNEVGLYVDAQDRVWGVENGRDDLNDADLGGDIHTDNPGEEINLIDGQGSTFYGYPLCFTEFALTSGMGAGTQWADDSIAADSRKTDAWCRDPANVHPPVFSMQAHWAPLGIVQYTGSALPFTGDFIIAAHGSWDRVPATGRVLARARVSGSAITAVEPIVGAKNGSGQLNQGAWDARPVDVRQGPDEALYFSDDAGGRVFKLGYAE